MSKEVTKKTVDGEILTETNETVAGKTPDGYEIKQRIHTRCIDDRCYEKFFTVQTGPDNIKCLHVSLPREQGRKFDQEWDEKWKRNEAAGVFQRMKDFFRLG
jgi:hypothetical protein